MFAISIILHMPGAHVSAQKKIILPSGQLFYFDTSCAGKTDLIRREVFIRKYCLQAIGTLFTTP